MIRSVIRIGSRGSQLALWQANHISAALRSQGHAVEIVIIQTTGDKLQHLTFAQTGTKGMFTKEIEEALADGRIDLAVHSLKDLPTTLDGRFVLAAIPAREDARDVLVSEKFAALSELPPGAKVGTSSVRRQSQLRALRPDLELMELRGNVDTRLRKLHEGQAAAIVLAAAGLERLERMESVRQHFSVEEMCPAPGQGALGIECRAEDERTRAALRFLDDVEARFTTTAERAALAALGGGCQVPIGVYCSAAMDAEDSCRYSISAVVSSPHSSEVVRAGVQDVQGITAERLGGMVADRLMEQGAGELLKLSEKAQQSLA